MSKNINKSDEIAQLRYHDYAELLTERCVERFMRKLFLSGDKIKKLVIISPFISKLEDTRFSLQSMVKKIEKEHILTFVITQQPQDEYHRLAVQELLRCNYAEIRFNSILHAKLYIAMPENLNRAYAMFGSANLTKGGIERNIELAMMIYGRGKGRDIINELFYWGTVRLRTHRNSKLIKRMKHIRR